MSGAEKSGIEGRRKLPPRRQNETRRLEFQATHDQIQQFFVTLGFDPAAGDLVEVFARPRGRFGRSGVQVALADDVAVLLSILIQLGVDLDALALRLGRHVEYPKLDAGPLDEAAYLASKPSSFVGALVDLMRSLGRDPEAGA